MRALLDTFSRALHSLIEGAARSPRRTLTIAAAIVIFFAAQLPRLKTELQVYNIVDPSFPSATHLDEMRDRFEDGHEIFLIFRAKEGRRALSASELCSVKSWVDSELRHNPELESAVSPFDLRSPSFEGPKIWYRKLLPSPCENRGANLEPLRQTPWWGILTDKSLHDVGVQFRFRESEGVSLDPLAIGRLLEAAAKGPLLSEPGLAMEMNGDASFQWHFHTMMKRDGLLNGLIVLVFVAFFRLFYGTWRSGFLLVTTLLMSTTVVYGSMALWGTPVDLLSNNLFLITAIAGLEDFLFISFLMRKRGGDVLSSFKYVALPCFFTSLATSLDIGSLAASDLLIIRRFGIWTALGAFTEFFMTFLVLPSVCRLWPRCREGWTDSSRAVTLGVLGKLGDVKLGRWAPWASFGLFVVAVLASFHLNYDDSPRDNFPVDHPHSRSFRYLSDTRGWEGLVHVVFPRAEKEDDVRRVAGEIASLVNVARVDDPFTLRDWFTRNAPDRVTASLLAREYSATAGYRRYFSYDDQVRVSVYLQSLDLSRLGVTLERIEEICRPYGCRSVGESVVFHEYSSRVSRTLTDSFAVSLLMVAVIIGFLMTAMRRPASWAAAFMYSTVWAPFIMIGAMAVFRVSVNLVTCMFAAVVVGLTGDNAIHYLFAAENRELSEGIVDMAGATVEMMFLLSTGSLVLLTLTMVPMKVLGVLFFFGFVTTLVGDLWLLRSLMPEEST